MSYRFSPHGNINNDELQSLGRDLYQSSSAILGIDQSPERKRKSLPVCPPDAEEDTGPPPDLPRVGGFQLPPPQLPSAGVGSVAPNPRPLITARRDPRAIRQQYMANLGIEESKRQMQRESARRQAASEGIRVKVKGGEDRHPNALRGGVGLLSRITRWYGGSPATEEPDSTTTRARQEGSHAGDKRPAEANAVAEDLESCKDDAGQSLASMGIDSKLSGARDGAAITPTTFKKVKKHVDFDEEAKVILIPTHHEYTALQRDRLWHTRQEFLDMVERNLDEMYAEMEEEYQAELLQQKEERMRQEESIRQRLSEVPPQSIYDSTEQQQRLVRSQMQIRQQYLKNLGFDGSRSPATMASAAPSSTPSLTVSPGASPSQVASPAYGPAPMDLSE